MIRRSHPGKGLGHLPLRRVSLQPGVFESAATGQPTLRNPRTPDRIVLSTPLPPANAHTVTQLPHGKVIEERMRRPARPRSERRPWEVVDASTQEQALISVSDWGELYVGGFTSANLTKQTVSGRTPEVHEVEEGDWIYIQCNLTVQDFTIDIDSAAVLVSSKLAIVDGNPQEEMNIPLATIVAIENADFRRPGQHMTGEGQGLRIERVWRDFILATESVSGTQPVLIPVPYIDYE